MAKWDYLEYKSLLLEPTDAIPEKKLNKLGREGWELINSQVIYISTLTGAVKPKKIQYIFKRLL